jgi:curved DNA-binding protein CbpA
MAGTNQFEGLGAADAMVTLARGVDVTAARLTTQEGFVLSRVDGKTTLHGLCLVSGLGEEPTLQILRRLFSMGLIVVGGERHRRRRSTGTSPAVAPDGSAAPGPPQPSVETKAPAPPPDPAAFQDDDPAIELKLEVRAAVRKLHGKLGELNFFEILDVPLDADAAAIKRAYFKRSKEFHPDRFYSRNVGAYGTLLEEIFKQVSAAYRLLEDEKQRESYRQMVLQEMEQKSLLQQVEEQGIRALREDEKVHGRTPTPPRGLERPSGEYIFSRSDLGLRAATGVGNRVRQVTPDPGLTEEGAGGAEAEAGVRGPERETETQETQQREQRRDQDRQRRVRKVTTPFLGRAERARGFYEQGVRQLTAGQFLAAAASLKLALTFGGENPEFRRLYVEAVDKSRALTAETYFKRAIFEESVGRMELAHKFYVQAADTLPKGAYLERAAGTLLAAGDLIKAMDYATKAVQAEPTSVEAHITLARVYGAAGMGKNARRELERALELDRGNAVAIDLLKTLSDR